MPLEFGLLLIPAVIAAFVIYDRITHLEYTHYPSAWQQDGQPGGFFRSPPNANRQTRTTTFYSWLFKTPMWARDDQQIRRLL
jgi:hypothetical protein